jgi:hypothetical protein
VYFTPGVKRGRDGMVISKGFGTFDLAFNRFLKSSPFLKPGAIATGAGGYESLNEK